MFKLLRNAKWCKLCICGEDFHKILLSRQFSMQNIAKLTPFHETIFFCQQKVKDLNILQELEFKWDDHHLIWIDVKWILKIFWKTNFQEVNRVSQKDIKWWKMNMPTGTFSFLTKNLRTKIFPRKYNSHMMVPIWLGLILNEFWIYSKRPILRQFVVTWINYDQEWNNHQILWWW